MSQSSGPQTRHKGFVASSHKPSGKPTAYTVRVKDESSPHNGKKLPVASIHDDLALSRGLNVNFCIGSMDGQREEIIHCAVDIQLEESASLKNGGEA